MKKLKQLIIGLAAIVGIATVPVVPALAVVQCTSPANCAQTGVNNAGGTTQKTTLPDVIKTVINIIVYILGAISVIMIIIGGVRYVVSGGDSSAVKGAKDTILYAIVGLVIALLAYAIVNFVIGQFV